MQVFSPRTPACACSRNSRFRVMLHIIRRCSLSPPARAESFIPVVHNPRPSDLFTCRPVSRLLAFHLPSPSTAFQGNFCPTLHPQESRRTLSPLLLSRGPNTTALLISVCPAPPGHTTGRPRSHQASLSGLAHPAPLVSYTQPPASHWPPLAPHALHRQSQRPHPLSQGTPNPRLTRTGPRAAPHGPRLSTRPS